ncbi:MAG: hypothetical protein ABS904_00115 [Solibacillus isronensis]
MQNNRYRINFNLSTLLEDGAVTLNKESEAGFEPSQSLGFESAIENFLEYYNFLPLFNTSFSLVTSLGAVVNVEHAPLRVKTDTNPKGKIIDLQLKNGDTYKFFVVDSDIDESRSVIDRLMWGLREIGNKPKEYKLSIKGACHLSEAIGYMIINSDFFNDPIAQWQNGEYDTPHVDSLPDKEPVNLSIASTLTLVPHEERIPKAVTAKVTGDAKNILTSFSELLNQLLKKDVVPLGHYLTDEFEWVHKLSGVLESEGSQVILKGFNEVPGFIVTVRWLEANISQDLFVKGNTRMEAGSTLKTYLKEQIKNYEPLLYEKTYQDFTDSSELAKDVIQFVMSKGNVNLITGTNTAPSKGISTDFMKKD